MLVTGASGGVGALSIGIARRLGATVTAIGSGKGLELAKRLGAEHVIDRKAVTPIDAAKGPYDVIVDAAAAYRWKHWRGKLAKGGAFVSTLPSLGFFIDKVMSLFSPTRAMFVNVKSRATDLKLLGEWLADGLEVPIDRVVPVKDVAGALDVLHKGAAVGRIGVDVANGF